MIGIIDRSYVGSILIPLKKMSDDVDDLDLPMRVAQIIPQPIFDLDLIQVDEDEQLPETARGQGGFGSTGDN